MGIFRSLKKENIKNKENLKEKKTSSPLLFVEEFFLLSPVLLSICIIPIIVGLHVDEIPQDLQRFWVDIIHVDMFAHHSAKLTIFVAVIMCIIIFLKFKKETMVKSKTIYAIMGLLLLYAMLAILSTIFALNRDVALWGGPGRYEGVFVQLSYITIVIYTLLILSNINVKQYVYMAVIFISTVIATLGIAQLMGKDLLLDSPIYNIIMLGASGTLVRGDGGAGIKDFLSLTFGNSNYFGSYAALIIPLLLTIILDKSNSNKQRLYTILLSLISVTLLFASKSQAGIVGLFAGSILMILLLIVLGDISKKALFTGMIIFIMSVGFTYMIIPESNKNLILDIASEAMVLFKKTKKLPSNTNYDLPIHNMQIDGRKVEIYTDQGDLKMIADNENNIRFEDIFGKSLQSTYNYDTEKYYIEDPFEDLMYTVKKFNDEKIGITLQHSKGSYFYIEIDKQEGIFLVDQRLNRFEIQKASYIGFEGKERIGSGRGYIWSRSLPLLKDTIIKGYGPDNFWLAFPQNDFWAKAYTYDGDGYMLIDKPHNMYLQWGINNGVVATLSLLVAFGIYIVKSIRDLIRSNENDTNRTFKLGILCSVVGYLATGIFNDSVTSVAPIFWVLFGLGVSMMEYSE